MTLEQGQLWKKGDDYIRITQWARLSIEYKLMKDPATKEGTLHHLSKKEFCRFLKGATLVVPPSAADSLIEPESSPSQAYDGMATSNDS